MIYEIYYAMFLLYTSLLFVQFRMCLFPVEFICFFVNEFFRSLRSVLSHDLLLFRLAVEFDFSGNYLAIGGSDIRYVSLTCNYWYSRVHVPDNVIWGFLFVI